MLGEPLNDELLAKLDRWNPAVYNGSGRVLLLGDSMLAHFQDYGTGRGLLDPEQYDNIAIGGTTTRHWIWLLNSSLLSKIRFERYKRVFLMLGTNDLAVRDRLVEEIVNGLADVVHLLRNKMSKAHITFIPIFPRGDLPMRPTLVADTANINAAMAPTCDSILESAITASEMYDDDQLHLNRKGYEAFSIMIKNSTKK